MPGTTVHGRAGRYRSSADVAAADDATADEATADEASDDGRAAHGPTAAEPPTGGPAPVTVLVVDDHAMFAGSVAAVLGAEPDIDVVGTAKDLAGAFRALASTSVDVLLLDHRLPDGRGAAAVADLVAAAPATRVVVLTGDPDDASMLAAVEGGCAGFLDKNRSVDELVAAVRAAAAGEVLVSPALLGRLVHRLRTRRRDTLTRRELEVLALIAEGCSNAVIAERLVVSVNTVRNHVASILGKLGAHSKLEALAVAVRDGLLPGGRP